MSSLAESGVDASARSIDSDWAPAWAFGWALGAASRIMFRRWKCALSYATMSIVNCLFEIAMLTKSTLSKVSAVPAPKKKAVPTKGRRGVNPFTCEQPIVVKMARGSGKHFTFLELMKADEPRRVLVVHDGLQSLIMEEAAQALAVPKATLFGAIGVPVSTMSRRLQSGARLSLDESDKVDRVAQAFKRAIDVFGQEQMAREWMSTRLLALGDRTPLELLDSSAGYQMVLNTIGRIAYGAPA